MGLDISAHLVYGVKLPEEFKIEDEELSVEEAIDELFHYSKPDSYPGLTPRFIGSCDEPEVIIGLKEISVDWTAEPIEAGDLCKIYNPTLVEFCKDFDIKYEPKWYLGCYVSY